MSKKLLVSINDVTRGTWQASFFYILYNIYVYNHRKMSRLTTLKK